ncbi:uncharacterized protein J7T54_001101 [Emericellopsis cladophorae]|uniref:F-box domain-containing protein n=1 Tax=Emericellopsis cladophorae TaxID=2686198 RepID=A0A9P9XZH4_9HYPO|nr:uncharacterized protein J7T54_001101 [Emericellopsis cladophorae]KAI6780793.1 hypothetical protein J7T54_001101 [Emericellopsis cladophorae]
MALYSIIVDASRKDYLAHMPEEIKRLIADHLPNGDLLRLARVSPVMKHQALFVLHFRDATQGTSEAIKFAVVRSCLAPAGKEKNAVSKSCRNIFERSLRLGANVNTIHVRGSSRVTALAVAAAFKNGLFWVRRLLAAGADRTIISKNLLAMPELGGLCGKWKEQCRKIDSPRIVDKVLRGQTEWLPLCVPAVMRYDDICNVLCESEKSSPYLTVPYDAVDTHRLTILHTYAWELDTDTPGQCLQLFEKYPDNWNDLIPLAGYNALHLAIASGNMMLFDKFLDASNVIIDSQEWTSSPITWVIEECAETSKHHEQKAMAQRRQCLKPDLNALHECDTLLHTAFPAACTPLTALLIALANSKSCSSESGLWSMFHKMVDEHGADVNVHHPSQSSLTSQVFDHILGRRKKDLLSEGDAKSLLKNMRKVGARLRITEAQGLLMLFAKWVNVYCSRLDIHYGATEAIADIQELYCLGAKVGSELDGVSAIDEFYRCADKFNTADTRGGAVMDKIKLKLFEVEREERRRSRNGSR